MSELKECPNPACKSTNVKAMTQTCAVVCRDCLLCSVSRETIAAAIAAWNTRTAAKQDNWQDIESAPIETDILIKYHSGRGGRCAVACVHETDGFRDIYIAGTDIEIDPDHLEGWRCLYSIPAKYDEAKVDALVEAAKDAACYWVRTVEMQYRNLDLCQPKHRAAAHEIDKAKSEFLLALASLTVPGKDGE